MTAVTLLIQQLPHAYGLPLPHYATAQAAGMDVMAALSEGEQRFLKTGERTLVPTGLVLQIPEGYEVQVRPRSGLALKHGVTVLNSPGTIDADYRGEVGIILVNLGFETFLLERGMRIAQLVLAKVEHGHVQHALSVQDSERGAGGFGSTGLRT
jgi:dUTP pyrophosphatase